MSFGYRHGVPPQADLVLDVRFLPNPYFVPELKGLTGKNPKVSAYVLDRAEVVAFFLAVVFGGAFGAAWSVQRATAANLTGADAGGYNVRTSAGPMRPGESGEESFPSMVRK